MQGGVIVVIIYQWLSNYIIIFCRRNPIRRIENCIKLQQGPHMIKDEIISLIKNSKRS